MSTGPFDGRSLVVHRLGRIGYAECHALQEALLEARQAGEVPDTLLLLEHDPVVTLGRSAKEANILAPREFLASHGIDVHETGRGGDVTYHGPGQLVAYPIFDLKPTLEDVRKYVRILAEIMIELAAGYGIGAGYVTDKTLLGVWVDTASPGRWPHPADATAESLHGAPIAKLGAIGVRLSRWVTMHGFALNISTNLAHFQYIIPCNIPDHGVTSLEALGAEDRDTPMSDPLAAKVLAAFLARFGGEGRLASPAETARLRQTYAAPKQYSELHPNEGRVGSASPSFNARK